jgi:hypothetical protein
MAIKVNTEEVIRNDRVLQNITGIGDSSTRVAINDAIKLQSNILTLYDSTGAVVRTLYCAADVGI